MVSNWHVTAVIINGGSRGMRGRLSLQKNVPLWLCFYTPFQILEPPKAQQNCNLLLGLFCCLFLFVCLNRQRGLWICPLPFPISKTPRSATDWLIIVFNSSLILCEFVTHLSELDFHAINIKACLVPSTLNQIWIILGGYKAGPCLNEIFSRIICIWNVCQLSFSVSIGLEFRFQVSDNMIRRPTSSYKNGIKDTFPYRPTHTHAHAHTHTHTHSCRRILCPPMARYDGIIHVTFLIVKPSTTLAHQWDDWIWIAW